MKPVFPILCCALLLVVGWCFLTPADTQLIPLDLTFDIAAPPDAGTHDLPIPPDAGQATRDGDGDMALASAGGCRGVCPLPPNDATAPEATAEREGRRLGTVVSVAAKPVRVVAAIKPVRRVLGLLRRR